MEIYLSLGSNLGDRRKNIIAAISGLESFFSSRPAAVSEILEFPSWGFDAPDFLNCVVRFDIPDCGVSAWLYAHALLHAAKRLEAAAGRQAHELYSPEGERIYHSRTIDIDILYVGNETIKSQELTIPHPLIGQRDFVLVPLRAVITENLLIARENR